MATEVCAPGRKRRTARLLYFRDGGKHSSFNYTEHLDNLIGEWICRYPQLKHLDMDRVVLSLGRCRSRSYRGEYANITSLRFPYGDEPRRCGDKIYRWPTILKNGRAALYLIKFYLPRFHNLSFEDKVSTILHELHHIDPKFNGRFRNFGGRHWAHGPSQNSFERMYESLKRDIMGNPGRFCELFLHCRFSTLLKRFGDVYGDTYACLRSYEQKPSIVI